MKFIFCLLICLCCLQTLFADSPPSFEPFSVYSENKEFFARIEKIDENYIISVFGFNDSYYRWQNQYFYDGYTSGRLTNDGRYFVYINDWLEIENQNQICIYSYDTSYCFSGNELGLDGSLFPHTASHQIWINDWRLNDTSILVKTLDGDFLKIRLNNFSHSKEKIRQTEDQIEQIKNIKQITILLLLFIGFGILILLISRIRAIKKRKEKL